MMIPIYDEHGKLSELISEGLVHWMVSSVTNNQHTILYLVPPGTNVVTTADFRLSHVPLTFYAHAFMYPDSM